MADVVHFPEKGGSSRDYDIFLEILEQSSPARGKQVSPMLCLLHLSYLFYSVCHSFL